MSRDNVTIYQGQIATHNEEPFLGQVVIDKKNGIISDVLRDVTQYKADRVFSDSCLIFPGMGDIHIHAREAQNGSQDHKEVYTTAGNAGLNGGLTHVSAMPNTDPVLVDLEGFNWHRNRISEINHPTSILNYVGIAKGTRPIGKPGEHPYKAFFGKSVGDLTFYDEHELEETLRHYKGHNVSFHVEYEPFIEASVDGKTHTDRRPIGAVNHGLKLLLPLIEKYEINAKLCHWSTGGDSFRQIAQHREMLEMYKRPQTTVEVSPLHLLFDKEMADENPSLWLKIQMNPAVQDRRHRQELIEGLREGFIQFLATDHAPHTEEEKHAAFAIYKEKYPNMSNIEIAELIAHENPELFNETCCRNGMSGAPWLDNYAQVCTLLMKEHGFTPQDIARVTAYNPGEFVNQFLGNQFPQTNFGKGFGQIALGNLGSLTVLNTNKPQVVTRNNLQTKCGWSPLEEREFSGGLEAVIIRGEDMTGKFIH